MIQPQFQDSRGNSILGATQAVSPHDEEAGRIAMKLMEHYPDLKNMLVVFDFDLSEKPTPKSLILFPPGASITDVVSLLNKTVGVVRDLTCWLDLQSKSGQ